ncbi:MAG: cytochrome c oxidase subunit 3 family protein [Pseudomonadota bacterium]
MGRRLPGEEGIWVFVLGDLVVFTLFFGTYLYYRAEAPQDYDLAQSQLNLALGTLNTLILLTSSWLVAQAVRAARSGKPGHVKRSLMGAIGFGFVFCGIKVIEYTEKFGLGIGVGTNDFFMFFFMLTGIHLVHVVIGLIVLVMVYRQMSGLVPTTSKLMWLENGATYWHLVDLLWIILFALLYVLRA